MKRAFKIAFLFLAAILIGSCNTSKQDTYTYFGGKIIHPKSEYVLLFSNETLIDTLFLDKEDKFLGKYKDFNEGFYYFKHGGEFQYVYLQPKDSILIRLNTWDFDESLVFSGNGAEKNNILIDNFLEQEKENKNYSFRLFYKLSPKDFKAKMDSVLAIREYKIKEFKKVNENLPNEYLTILEVVSKYPIYRRFERYLVMNKHLNKGNNFQKVPNNFYSYRKNININNDSLLYLQTYSNYIVNRLHNEVYTKGISFSSKKFTPTLLNTIDTHINREKLKNTLLKEMVMNDFLENSSCAVNNEMFQIFFKLSTNNKDKKYIQKLLNDVKNLHGGNTIPDFNVINYNHTSKSIKEVINNRNSVIYFWNPKYVSANFLSSRIKYLNKKVPKLNFVGVMINEVKINEPIKGIDIKKQFYINKESKANSFLSSKLPRTLLVNKKGLIVNGYASITSYKILKQLKHLQKQ